MRSHVNINAISQILIAKWIYKSVLGDLNDQANVDTCPFIDSDGL